MSEQLEEGQVETPVLQREESPPLATAEHAKDWAEVTVQGGVQSSHFPAFRPSQRY